MDEDFEQALESACYQFAKTMMRVLAMSFKEQYRLGYEDGKRDSQIIDAEVV